MLRNTKIALIVVVALWGFVGSFQNLVNWNGTLAAVEAATSMSTFEGGRESWQATSNSLVVWLGALFICVSKLAAAVLCSIGATRMWRARKSAAAEFQSAKEFALAGCAIAIIMLFGGFIVIAESWFELWRSDALRGTVLGSAFRYAGMIALTALFTAMRDE